MELGFGDEAWGHRDPGRPAGLRMCRWLVYRLSWRSADEFGGAIHRVDDT